MAHPLYFIEVSGQKIRGKWFLECDRDETRADVLDTIGIYSGHVVKVLLIDEEAGTVRDVTSEMVGEAEALAGEDKARQEWINDADRSLTGENRLGVVG